MNYGLIGEKLGHSFSADIHKRLFGYDYELKELKPDELSTFLRNRDFKGINVTIPYKQTVIPYLDYLDESVKHIGVVNTVVNTGGKLYGYNTDYFGLKALIARSGISLEGETVLILGSGATSKTALAASDSLGAMRVLRVSRTEQEGCITYAQAMEKYGDAEIIINTTPCGMYPNNGACPIDLSYFAKLQGVIDVVYNPLRTKLVCDAMQRGIPSISGLYMLMAQAAYAGALFTGKTLQNEEIDAEFRLLTSLKQNVVLIGMPGCGKSTVGQELAIQIGFEFIDTDKEIERTTGRTIVDIFASDGEEKFRELEASVIEDVSKRQHCVIATGGGTVLNAASMIHLRQNGCIYFLDRSLSLLSATADRPLSSNREALEKRYQERYDRYRTLCDKRISADSTTSDIVKLIREDLTL